MPKHNFKCPKCGYKFEADIGMNDPNPKCPWSDGPTKLTETVCGTVVKKDFNWGISPAVHFHGGGWSKDS